MLLLSLLFPQVKSQLGTYLASFLTFAIAQHPLISTFARPPRPLTRKTLKRGEREREREREKKKCIRIIRWSYLLLIFCVHSRADGDAIDAQVGVLSLLHPHLLCHLTWYHLFPLLPLTC